MSGYRNKKEKRSRQQPGGSRRLLKNPWIFAGSALLLDTAMLAVGLILSNLHPKVEYTLTSDSVEHSQPLAFFGIIAAAALGIVCVLTAFIIAGAFLKKRRAAQIAGAAALLVVSVVMIGASALTALGIPAKDRTFVSYSDDYMRLIIEEEQPYSGTGKAYFFMTDTEGSHKVKLLACTDIAEYSTADDDRYTVEWLSEDSIAVSFPDGGNYRTLQMSFDRSYFKKDTPDLSSILESK